MRKGLYLGYLFLVAMIAVAFSADVMGVQSWVVGVLNLAPGETGAVLAMAIIAPFPVDPELSGIAIAYRNPMNIADRVMPRKFVGKQNFKYRKYPKGTFITRPDTRVSRTSAPNRVEMGYEELSSATEDYALDDGVPQADIENAPAEYNPLGEAAEFLIDLVELDRELRVASTVFNADNYNAANKKTLAGQSQWSDHDNSDPIDEITAAIDACFVKPNKFVMGRSVFTQLAKHPVILKGVHGTLGDTGYARRQQIEDIFELEIVVGEGWYNSAKPGQDVVTARMWGKHASLLYINPTATPRRGLTWGLTAQWGERVSGSIDDPDVGMRGGKRVRSGESVKEVVVADDCGYFFENAVA